MADAGWNADPTGRFAQRYWDGAAWTDHVSDAAGAQSTDAFMPAPPPPVATLQPPAPAPYPAGGPQYAQYPVGAPAGPRDAKAAAKAAKAYAKAQRPFWKKKRVILPTVLILLIVVISVAASGGSDNKSAVATTGGVTTTKVPGVDKGLGSKDASADVVVNGLAPADALGFREADITITNNSSKRSNYSIELSLESPDGKTQYDNTYVTASNVEPGQSTKGNVLPFTKTAPASAVVKVKTVSRTAA